MPAVLQAVLKIERKFATWFLPESVSNGVQKMADFVEPVAELMDNHVLPSLISAAWLPAHLSLSAFSNFYLWLTGQRVQQGMLEDVKPQSSVQEPRVAVKANKAVPHCAPRDLKIRLPDAKPWDKISVQPGQCVTPLSRTLPPEPESSRKSCAPGASDQETIKKSPVVIPKLDMQAVQRRKMLGRPAVKQMIKRESMKCRPETGTN